MANTSFSETHPVGANNIGYEGKPVSANNIFADLDLVRDPVGTALRSGIRRLGEVPSRFMMIDEIVEVAEEAARQFGDPGVRGVIVDKQWDGLATKRAIAGSREASGPRRGVLCPPNARTNRGGAGVVHQYRGRARARPVRNWRRRDS